MQLVVHVRGLGENAGVTRWTLDRFADQDKELDTRGPGAQQRQPA